jgi:AcrR family transcriptional regulator
MDNSQPPSSPNSKRGRPRSAEAREAILRSTRELLDERGLAAVTIEAIASRSGISRPTIYRYWKNSYAVAMEAFLETTGLPGPPRPSNSPVLDLAAHLRKVASVFATRAGRGVAAMIAASVSETELSKAFRNHFIAKSREEGRKLLQAAIAQKELRPDLDIEVTLDLLYAPLFFRLLIGHAELTPKFTNALIEHLLAGLRPSL